MKIIVWLVILFILLGCSVEIIEKVKSDFSEFIQQPLDFEEIVKEFLVYLPLLVIIFICLLVVKKYLLKTEKLSTKKVLDSRN